MNKTLALIVLGLMSSLACAGDDPSIKGALRSNIQEAMTTHIAKNQIKGDYVLYDSVTGKMLRLNLDELHKGIVAKGDFYVSCADFSDAKNNKYDVDFMVAGSKTDLSVYQAIVHKDKAGKRKYHLEN